MTKLNPYLIGLAVAIIVLASVPSRAQGDIHSYKVGERVEYKDRSYPESWKEGTIVKVLPEYNQVVVHWDPRPDYPSYTHNGVSIYEQAYNISAVRHIKPHGDNAAPANGGAANRPVNRSDNETKRREEGSGAADVGNGKGPMTKQEMTSYMLAHAYSGGQPTHNLQACKDLIEQIKRRGVVARLEPGKDDLAPFNGNGCAGAQNTDVVEATKVNLGPPTTLDWLSGTWLMYVVGGTVDYAPGDGYIYRKNESVAKLGFLTINSNGTYTWKVNPSDPPAKYVKGTWRMATRDEMDLRGGAGIVLQKAAEGTDWIVFKYMDPFTRADRVDVRQLQPTGGYRRIGWRR